jgi:hypothetical protein
VRRRSHHVGGDDDRGFPLCAKVGVDSADAPASIVLHQAPTGIYIELVSVDMKELMFGEGR